MAPSPRNLLSTDRLGDYVTHLGDISTSPKGEDSSSSHHLGRRDSKMIAIPNTYTDITDSPGIVAAIVLGTVCGFVLLIWVVALIFNRRGMFPQGDTGTVVSSSETSASFAFSKSQRRRPEVAEVHGGGRRASRERVREEDEFAEVYDEDEYESPPPPSRRRGSGYRAVNPRRYGG